MWSGDCHIEREKDIVVVYFVCLTVDISHKQYGLYRKINNKILICIYKEALNVVLFMYIIIKIGILHECVPCTPLYIRTYTRTPASY